VLVLSRRAGIDSRISDFYKRGVVLVEQAIFTSARTGHGDGYQVVARSPGVADTEARELSAWGPSHGALNSQQAEASSVNFHRLASGRFCVSKTVAAGGEYSQRGGARIYTQSLLVAPEIFARFANNPFAVLRAARAKGALAVHEVPPAKLPAFSLVGRSITVDEGLLGQLADRWKATRVGWLVAAAMTNSCKLVVGAEKHETLFGGLVNCFPPESRPDLTFTTGLRYSPRRPYRFTTTQDDAVRHAARSEGMTVVDLRDPSLETQELHGWPAYVARAIETDQLPHLTSALQQPRPDLTMDQLDELGRKLLADLDACPIVQETSMHRQPPQRDRSGGTFTVRTDSPLPSAAASSSSAQSSTSPAAIKHRGPALALTSSQQTHTVTDPQTIDLLEQLDDTVYDCIHGAPNAIETIGTLWQNLSQRLRPDVLAAAREQYMRYALTLWEACLDSGSRQPQHAMRALDVLTALFERD
jgi:hypothetical protein